MGALARVLSLLVAGVGVAGLLSPLRLLEIARGIQGPGWLYAGAAFRVLLGVALLWSARASRAPRTLRVLGILVLVAGLVGPFIGVPRAQRLLAWWAARGPAFMRAWAGFAIAFGLLLASAVGPRASAGAGHRRRRP